MGITIDTQIRSAWAVTVSRGIDTGNADEQHTVAHRVHWPDGTGASAADEVWSDQLTVGAAAWNNHDLSSIALVDDDGDTIRTVTFSDVKAVKIVNSSAADYLTVGGGTNAGSAADAWAGVGTMFNTDASICNVPAGGHIEWSNPASGTNVANGTADILSVGGITSTQTYSILLIGLD